MANIDAYGGDANAFLSAGKASGPGSWNKAMGNTPGIDAYGRDAKFDTSHSGWNAFGNNYIPGYETDIRDHGYWEPSMGGKDPYNRFSSDGFFGPYDLLFPGIIGLAGAGIGMGLDLWRGNVSPTLRK